MRRRRPFTALTALGTAAHHGFELRSGVGLVFEPFLGRRGAVATWAGVLPARALGAAFGGGRWLGNHAAASYGSGSAGGLVYFALWPWERGDGIPYLTEAAGQDCAVFVARPQREVHQAARK